MGGPGGRDVLVVGAGLAGVQTVAELRDAGFDGRIRVIGAEGLPPYDRPPLSKHLFDRPTPAWLTAELGVDLAVLADEVHLERPARALLLGGDRPAVRTDAGVLVADDVVLATGARAVRVPGWDAAATLHTAADADLLRQALRPGTRLVVVGAGWIGAEVAGVVAAAGHPVTVVEAAGAPLAAALGERVGALTARWHDEAGVTLLTGARVARVEPEAVTLDDGRRLPADAVLAAVGARPATGWLAGALPLDEDGSVRVDAAYRVLAGGAVVPGVWAVGDVARRWSPRHGWVPGGHWDGALRGPRALVGHLLGRPPEPPDDDPAPYVFSTQLGHDLALFGAPGAGDEVLLRGDPATGGWAALWLTPQGSPAAPGPAYEGSGHDKGSAHHEGSAAPETAGPGGTLRAVLVVDRPRDVGAARRLFTGPTLPRVDRGAAADPDQPLRALP